MVEAFFKSLLYERNKNGPKIGEETNKITAQLMIMMISKLAFFFSLI